MSKKKPSKKEALKILTQFSKQAFQNGIEYYKDAQLIYEENKSYGHAFGFLVLAEEEFGKAWFLHVIHENIRNDLTYFSDQEEAPRLSDIISNHKIKQTALEYLAKMTAVFMNKSDIPPFEEVTDEKAIQVLEEIFEEIENPKDNKLKTLFKKIERDYRSMQSNREEGFYVDLDPNSRNIIGPHRITKNECEKQFLKTQFTHWLCSMWLGVKTTKRHVSLLKKMDKLDKDK